MNTTEHIVEIYYRICKKCLTYTDFKVKKGNNRQFDVLAYNKKNNEFRHIEVSVTHSERWTANLDVIEKEIKYKFFGMPKNKRPDNPNTDFNKGKNYRDQIEKAYNEFGFKWDDVIRVWCSWFTKEDDNKLNKWKHKLSEEFELPKEKFEIISMRDLIIPNIMDEIKTSNYNDDIMRTISLIEQYRKQKARYSK